ncbi:replication initiation protein [Gordonia phage Asapag]|uniref:Helix-turn-helix DNA binding domain protein n=1 Tax=Gordonia phage Asapag TaxID=2507862 RepID=A0A410TDP6_9CAUD|nr:replication initiation protein [Gordonia phage Asapag]QAU07149.1 hypothetical protein SEA_ASAPAG_83 [Gordonia phage Asapag]
MKDARLYAKFTLDFPDSHKVMPLSDAAFRCLVEATLWSRKQLTDGLLPSRYAVAKWGLDVLQELMQNDPSNPSLIEVQGGYQIRDFAEHQDTKADIEARRQRNKEAGRKGGLAKSKQTAKQPASESLSESVAETETHIKNRFDDFWNTYPRKVGRKASVPAYASAIKTISEDELIEAARQYAAACKGSDPKFIAHPKTWLNQGRWDEFTASPSQTPEEFLNDCWDKGAVAPITELTGRKPDFIRWPEPIPEDFDQPAYVRDFNRRWIKDNRDELVEALRGRL